ncbi:hypothetical protein [Pediococcus argentinicus]|uniref:Small multidrug resistance protein n=1 Tax=Pediococcus argentinicus TaxID=480391 RepID=A0A0R2NK59_9LACO|nr:hypothetical protein [Pediococcus argentinicus]KRO26143.1 hypothetical protein IV88_GL000603 [Pediococcus argentinicus]NKZ21651.1 hypothetical protein [Pediococcus argentinicus]GEP18762.1 hypothetical protein LSA03_01460 [Pediococcus argentinicus]
MGLIIGFLILLLLARLVGRTIFWVLGVGLVVLAFVFFIRIAFWIALIALVIGGFSMFGRA